MDLEDTLFSESCSGIASSLVYGPRHQYSSLLAVGTTENRLCVKRCTVDDNLLQNVHNITQALHCDTIMDIPLNHPSNIIRKLSWSPDSLMNDSNVYIRLAALMGSRRVCLVTNNEEVSTLNEIDVGQSQTINDIAFHSLDGRILATVGDDSTIRMWDLEMGVAIWSLNVNSPAVSVCFNPQEPQQLLVAEIGGRIKFYNQSTKQPIRSIESPTNLLLQADWSHANSNRVGAVGGNNWICWDIRKSSLPSGMGVAHNSPSVGFKWCNTIDNVFSTISTNGQFKIHHYGHQKAPLTYKAPVINDMTWHPNLPIVTVATNKRICFWGVEN